MSLSEDTIDPVKPASPRTIGPLVRRLHFYAGVLVAPFILVAAVTGGLYAIAPTLERIVYDDILVVEPHGAAVPLSEQAAAARAAFPHLEMSGLRPPASPRESTRILFTDPALNADMRRAVFVNPYTSGVLGDEPVWFGYLPLSTWLDGLHRHLHLGEPGRVYSELAASWLWVVALGGVYLWIAKARNERRRGRPGRLVTVDRTVHGRARTLNWHGATGIWVLAMLLFLSATGITWSTYAGAHVDSIRSAFEWQRPELDTAMTSTGDEGGPIDFEAIVAAADRAGVHAPVELTLPSEPGQAVGVAELDKPYRLTTNAAAVDPETLAITNVLDSHRDYSVVAKLADWGIRMHMGFLFGLLNQVLLLTVAVAVVTMIVRGYRMWWQRRPTRGSAWALGRPPRRGGFLRLHPAAVAVIAATVVAVGWFLPLLGISLAAFLVIDLTIAAVKARGAPEASP